MRWIATKLIFCLLVSTQLYAASYHYVRIDVPNSTSTRVRGINARGDIVGIYEDATGGHSFLRHNGVFTDVAFPGPYFTAVKSINARGDMAGNLQDGPDGLHGFVTHDGVFSKIDYPGAVATQVRGINNAGDVTGVYDSANGRGFGFILKAGVYRTVNVPGSIFTDVYAVQDNGNVMVGDAVLRSDGGVHGFIRLGDGNYRILNFRGISSGTVVRWINQRGDIVGDLRPHGFLLRNGTYTSIDYPGAVDTAVLSINDDGVIVGFYFDTQGHQRGFKAVPQ